MGEWRRDRGIRDVTENLRPAVDSDDAQIELELDQVRVPTCKYRDKPTRSIEGAWLGSVYT